MSLKDTLSILHETDSEILADDQYTYSNLREQIGSGGNITLTKGTYTYNSDDGDTIKITNPCMIDGNGAVIDMAGFNKFGGFGGGNQMQNMIRQAQKMQQEMQRKQEELANTEIIGASGGGMVEVVITGTNEIKAVRIKPEAVDPDDVEMLEDLIMAAIKDAQSKAKQMNKDALGPMGAF